MAVIHLGIGEVVSVILVGKNVVIVQIFDVLALSLIGLDLVIKKIAHCLDVQHFPKVDFLSEPPLLVSSTQVFPVVFQILVSYLNVALLFFHFIIFTYLGADNSMPASLLFNFVRFLLQSHLLCGHPLDAIIIFPVQVANQIQTVFGEYQVPVMKVY